MFQARRFWQKSFRRTLEDTPDGDVEEKVTDAFVIFFRAEGEGKATGKPAADQRAEELKAADEQTWSGERRLALFHPSLGQQRIAGLGTDVSGISRRAVARDRLQRVAYTLWLLLRMGIGCVRRGRWPKYSIAIGPS